MTQKIDLKDLLKSALSGKSPKGALAVYAILILIPCFVFGYGAYHAYNYWDLQTNGTYTKSEIIRIDEVRSYTSPEANFYPVARFTDENGDIQEHIAGRAKRLKYEVGDTEHVYYDPKNPARVVLEGVIDRSMAAFYILMGMGAFGLLAIALIVRDIKNGKTF